MSFCLSVRLFVCRLKRVLYAFQATNKETNRQTEGHRHRIGGLSRRPFGPHWYVIHNFSYFAGGCWTFPYFASSLPGRFATWTFRTFGRFDTRTFRYLPGRFATCLKACNLWYCDNFSKSFFVFNKRGLLSTTGTLSMYATDAQHSKRHRFAARTWTSSICNVLQQKRPTKNYNLAIGR